MALSDESSGMVILTGNAHPTLAELVCERMGVRKGDAAVYNKSNRETNVDIKQSVRGKDVFIIQSAAKDVNNNIFELLILIYACKTSSARTVTVVMPYLPYSKQCRMLRRSAVTMKLVADMICRAGASRMVSLDLYKKEIQGFFSIPVDNLRASPYLLQYIRDNIPDFKNAVIVAKSPGVMHKASDPPHSLAFMFDLQATSYADRLRLGVAVIHGEEQKDQDDPLNHDGRQSPPVESKMEERPGSSDQKLTAASYELFPVMAAKEKPPLTVVGDVGGRIAILVDDIIDEAASFAAAAECLKKRGAYKIYVVATHGLLSSDAPKIIENSCIDEVIVTNTVPHDVQKMRCHKIKTVDISMILVEAIRRIYNKESMAFLFKASEDSLSSLIRLL
ncbi:Ribose-phosphate diphosphokinase family-containing protein [Aphelenchoides fujianensis]|nr:Ribose-phosphate diphosphokinase family-containing protein [Aphelenchoides fujianensis]